MRKFKVIYMASIIFLLDRASIDTRLSLPYWKNKIRKGKNRSPPLCPSPIAAAPLFLLSLCNSVGQSVS